MKPTVPEIQIAADRARDSLRALDKWATAFGEAQSEVPLFTKSSMEENDNYYIVQFRQDTRTTGLMLVDEFGEIGAIKGIEVPGESLFRFYRPNEIPALFERYGRELSSGGVGEAARDDRRLDLPVTINAEDIKVLTTLNWEPCDQSLTPFQPFYSVEHVRANGTDHFWVRVDGEIHTKLTHYGAGM